MLLQSVLLVCIGNICRSPTAQCILQQRLADKAITVSSAGLGALVGHAMDKTALTVLNRHGLDFPHHVARQLSVDIIRENDLILVMEKSHLQQVLALDSQARGKVFLLSQWLEQQDIGDPYRQSETFFEHVFTLIEQACDSWAKRLI